MEKQQELEDVLELLRSTVGSIEETVELQTKLKRSYRNLMKNANVARVDGLKIPNLFPLIQELNLQKQTLLTVQFHIECRIEDNKKLEKREQELREQELWDTACML
jgi:hypothetical protein